MTNSYFTGNLVSFKPLDQEKDLPVWEVWDRDSEYKRQLDIVSAVQYSATMIKELLEEPNDETVLFVVHTLIDDKTIGFVELDGFNWAARCAWVGIGIGDPDYRGKGFGTDAMKVLLHYAFRGLNLNRVNLNVFEFNKRAIASYEKCGFKYEGTLREMIYKDDRRWDVIEMGILRSEWEVLQN